MPKRLCLLVLAALFVGCTTSSTEPDAASTQPSETSSTIFEEARAVTSSTVAEDPSETVAEAESSPVAPLRPYDDAPPTTAEQADTSVYISRVDMSATSIEVKWSTHDDAVEYHLHRLPRTEDQQPSPDAMTADNMIHVAYDTGSFVDEGVESGVRYWHSLRALNGDGVAVAHGWHRTAAVTDTEPPSPVGALTAASDNGEVLVTWTRPDENYELHGYRVLRGIDGEDLESVTTTWNLDQTSFIDDGPPTSGGVTYAVVAFDFHWNESAPAQIDVDLG